jgi:hypothetical protein
VVQPEVLLCLVVPPIVGLYYFVAGVKVTTWSRSLRKRLPRTRYSSSVQADNIVRLSLAGLLQLLFLAALALALEVDVPRQLAQGFHPLLILYGALLGVGEMAFSSFLCHAVGRLAMAVAPGRVPPSMQDWMVVAKAGWMRAYLDTINAVPWTVSLGLIVLYVTVEEIIFRGILTQCFLPLGPGPAVVLSTGLFAIVQTVQMPSWSSTLFPVLGALVMGLAHGALFLAVPNLVPLIVAHCVFFLIAVY